MTDFVLVEIVNHQLLVSLYKSGFDSVSQPIFVFGRDLKPIYNKLDRMVFVTIEFHPRCQFLDIAVNSNV